MTEVLDAIHAVLFVADVPVTTGRIATALGLTEGQVEQALEILAQRLADTGPIQLVQLAGGYQLATKSEHMAAINEFLKPQRQKMTRSLLEVLAIVAYRQPVTLAEVDAVRGVQSDHAVRGLVERRMIQEVGRKHAPGRPVLYGTTQQFLHAFNLNDLSQLPCLATD